MNCPQCQHDFFWAQNLNPDGTTTCPFCKSTFSPEKYMKLISNIPKPTESLAESMRRTDEQAMRDSFASVNCPKCGGITRPNKNLELSDTCLNCGFTFRPDQCQIDEQVVNKLMDTMSNTRACVVTLQDGKFIVLTFDNSLEPKHARDTDKSRWRAMLEADMSRLVTRCFRSSVIHDIQFDDEIDSTVNQEVGENHNGEQAK